MRLDTGEEGVHPRLALIAGAAQITAGEDQLLVLGTDAVLGSGLAAHGEGGDQVFILERARVAASRLGEAVGHSRACPLRA